MYRVDEIEDAIVATVKAAGIDAKVFSREPTAARITAETTEKPVTLVIFERCEPAGTNFASLKGTDFFFHLVVAARNLSGNAAAERGDGSTTGIYELLNGIRQALFESTLGLTVQPMLFQSEKPLARTQRLSTYTQEWKLTVYE